MPRQTCRSCVAVLLMRKIGTVRCGGYISSRSDMPSGCLTLCASFLQDVDDARELVQKFGSKFNVFATEVNGSSYERLTLHGIRGNTQPGDHVLCAPCI